jgi:hypothetical protein
LDGRVEGRRLEGGKDGRMEGKNTSFSSNLPLFQSRPSKLLQRITLMLKINLKMRERQ